MHELHGLEQARSRPERQIVVPAAGAGTASLKPNQKTEPENRTSPVPPNPAVGAIAHLTLPRPARNNGGLSCGPCGAARVVITSIVSATW